MSGDNSSPGTQGCEGHDNIMHMRHYDLLPNTVRKALAEHARDICPTTTYHYYQRHYEEVEQMLKLIAVHDITGQLMPMED